MPGIWTWKMRRLAETSVTVLVAEVVVTLITTIVVKLPQNPSEENHLQAELGSMIFSILVQRLLHRWKQVRKRKRRLSSTILWNLHRRTKRRARRSQGMIPKKRQP